MCQEVRDNSMAAEFKFGASNLDKKDLFGKSDGFLRISKPADAAMTSWQPVHQTEVIKKSLNPIWNPFSVPMSKLNGGNVNLPLLWQVYDWNPTGKEDFIGEFRASFADVAKATQFELINAAKQGKRGYKNSGVLMVLKALAVRQYSFVEYIQGGTQINLMVAVDFTASNGNPKDANSLHFRARGGDTEYAQAIRAVGGIVGAYDHDQMFPAYGFGAKIPPNNAISHCFPLSFKPSPEVAGIDGILSAYYEALSKVTLHGPTNFSEFLDVASQIATQYHSTGGRQFLILLVITDGEITDMDRTVERIVK